MKQHIRFPYYFLIVYYSLAQNVTRGALTKSSIEKYRNKKLEGENGRNYSGPSSRDRFDMSGQLGHSLLEYMGLVCMMLNCGSYLRGAVLVLKIIHIGYLSQKKLILGIDGKCFTSEKKKTCTTDI